MKAVILAGGKGTRLRPLTDRLPKPMVRIDGHPVAEHQINNIRRYGITDIIFLNGYLGGVIEEYFGTGKQFGCSIEHVKESYPMGTGGTLKQIENSIKDDFLLIFGDVFFDIKLDDFISYHKRRKPIASLVAHPTDHPHDSDLLEIDEDHLVTGLLLKPHQTGSYGNLGNAGIFILSKEIFRYIEKDQKSDLMNDIFPSALRNREKIYAYRTAEYLKDMGTLERLEKVRKDYSSGKIDNLSKENLRPAVFIDRDGTLIEYKHLLHKPKELRFYDFSFSAIKKLNQSLFLSILATNQPVVARNLCDISQLRNIHNKMEMLLGEKGAYLDDILFCPHHPDSGYKEENSKFKIDCDCRKPKPGMIHQAAQKYNIDLKNSWIIGDSTTDIQTGQNSGLNSILVLTGNGGKDRKFSALPDFIFSNIDDAVEFIVNGKFELENTAREVVGKIDFRKKPSLVLIGGQARSGKTTLAMVLLKAMREKGIRARKLSLDNWLLDSDKRNSAMGVKERFQYSKIEKDICIYLKGKPIIENQYDPCSRKKVSEHHIQYNKESCIIIEGVPALDIEWLRDAADLKIFCRVDEMLRKKRYRSFYRWKGLSSSQIDSFYKAREIDELPVINQTEKFADMIVDISAFPKNDSIEQ